MMLSIADIMARLNADALARKPSTEKKQVTDDELVQKMEAMSKKGYIFSDKSVMMLRKFMECNLHGLIVMGEVGVGKTYFFHTVGLPILSLSYATRKHFEDVYRALEWWQNYDILVDDIGSEEKMTDFGKRKEILADIVDSRIQTDAKTFFTANLIKSEDPNMKDDVWTWSVLEGRYGSRVIDRIKQLATTICWRGESKREANGNRMDADAFERIFKHPVWTACKRNCSGWRYNDEFNCAMCADKVKVEPTLSNWRRCAYRHGYENYPS